MKSTFKIFPFLFLMYGVIGVDEDEVKTESVKTVSVMEGDSVTLNPDPTQIQGFNTILWRFGDNGTVIAQTDGIELFYPKHTEIFESRLQLNQTGSLTINNMRIKHSGLYQLQIYHNTGISSMTFSVTVSAVPDPRLSSGVKAGIAFGVIVPVLLLVVALIYYIRRISKLKKQMETASQTKVSVMEGKFITLPQDTELQGDDKIQWYYEDETNLIAEINKETRHLLDGTDGRFRGKLELEENGSLTITDIRTIHSGLYKLKISRNRRTKYKIFVVTVTARTVLVKEGDDVLLRIDAKIETGDLIMWTFGAKNSLIAKTSFIAKTDSRTPDIELFRDRLHLNENTGSLTIKNIRINEAGHYKLQIINSKQTTFRIFNVTVTGKQASYLTQDKRDEEHELLAMSSLE